MPDLRLWFNESPADIMVADEAHFKGNTALFRKTHC